MKTDGLELRDATYLALLAVGDVLTPSQQCRLQENFRKLAYVCQRRGETIPGNFLYALAQEQGYGCRPYVAEEGKRAVH
jgi:hypothetical protein